MFFNTILASLVVIVLYAVTFAASFRLLQNINIPHPAFPLFYTRGNHSALIVSTFNPLGSDNIFFFPEFSSQLRSGNVSVMTKLPTPSSFHWPNEISVIPPNPIFKNQGIIVASGFLPPGKTRGGIYVYEFADSNWQTFKDPITIVTTNQDWFYHRVLFADMTGKGTFDMITCRANKPFFGSTKQELVILTFDSTTSSWEPHVIAEQGCDIFFTVRDLDGDGHNEILASDFFGKKLVLFWTEDKTGNWLTQGAVKQRDIDHTCGALFDVQIHDMNGNGSLQALVTNHQGSRDTPTPSVFVYSIPKGKAIYSQEWSRTTILDKIPVVPSILPGQAAPGDAILFYPFSNMTKPAERWIALSGDGAQRAYLLKPVETVSQFKYELVWNQTFSSTVGSMLAQDLNGDGFAEIAVTAYDKATLAIYTFA